MFRVTHQVSDYILLTDLGVNHVMPILPDLYVAASELRRHWKYQIKVNKMLLQEKLTVLERDKLTMRCR